MSKLIENKIQCTHCHDVIKSIHRHDLVSCTCGKIYVDGGTSYARRGFQQESDFIELSVWEQ